MPRGGVTRKVECLAARRKKMRSGSRRSPKDDQGEKDEDEEKEEEEVGADEESRRGRMERGIELGGKEKQAAVGARNILIWG